MRLKTTAFHRLFGSFLSILVLIVLINNSQASDPIHCYLQLVPPHVIHRYGMNMLAQASIELAGKPGLETAAEITQDLLYHAGRGDFNIKIKEGLRAPFDFSIEYHLLDGRLTPSLRTITMSPAVAKVMFQQEKSDPLHVSLKDTLEPQLVKDWLLALAEVHTDFQLMRGKINVDSVNLWNAVQAQAVWVSAYAKAEGKQWLASPIPNDVELAEFLWPFLDRAKKSGDFRQLLLWFGRSHYDRSAAQGNAALAKLLERNADPQNRAIAQLNREMAMSAGRYFEVFTQLGGRAANVYMASKLLETQKLNPESSQKSLSQAEQVEREAIAQFEELYRQVAAKFERSKIEKLGAPILWTPPKKSGGLLN